MKKNKLMYSLRILFVTISILGFVSFLIVALIMREKQTEYHIWFICTGIFFVLSVLSLFLLISFTKTQDYKQLLSVHKIKNKRKVKGFTSNMNFANQLQSFLCEEISNGKLYSRESKNYYNRKKNSYDSFYFLKQKNSFDMSIEKRILEKQAEIIEQIFELKYQENSFINCVMIFLHDHLSENEKKFYYNFTGFWDVEINNGKFVRNRCFTYCGIDISDGSVYFYQSSYSDNGTEVDLGYLIIKELDLAQT